MSITSIQNSVERTQRDIQNLNNKVTDQTKKEADRSDKIFRAKQTISRSKSNSTIQNKQREIERYEYEITQIQKKKADLTKQISNKTKQLHSYQNQLTKAKDQQQRKQLELLKRDQSQVQYEQASTLNRIFYSQDNGESSSLLVENDVFTSHTSEDKKDLVDPLVEELIKLSVNIWYSEFQLTIEDLKKLVKSNARAIEALTNNFTEFQRIQENQSNQVMTIIRELQERQIQLQDTQERERETLEIMTEEMNRFIIRLNENKNRIEQLTGYSLSNESDHLNIQQTLRNLEDRINKLENQD